MRKLLLKVVFAVLLFTSMKAQEEGKFRVDLDFSAASGEGGVISIPCRNKN